MVLMEERVEDTLEEEEWSDDGHKMGVYIKTARGFVLPESEIMAADPYLLDEVDDATYDLDFQEMEAAHLHEEEKIGHHCFDDGETEEVRARRVAEALRELEARERDFLTSPLHKDEKTSTCIPSSEMEGIKMAPPSLLSHCVNLEGGCSHGKSMALLLEGNQSPPPSKISDQASMVGGATHMDEKGSRFMSSSNKEGVDRLIFAENRLTTDGKACSPPMEEDPLQNHTIMKGDVDMESFNHDNPNCYGTKLGRFFFGRK